MSIKKYAPIYGFDGYKVVAISDWFFQATGECNIPYDYYRIDGSYFPYSNLPVKVSTDYYNTIELEPGIIVNHKELLSSAKKLYIHSTCKISRSLVAEKYKKSLNPYLSDAVVIPEPDYSGFQLHDYALFINEQSKVILLIRVSDVLAERRIKEFNMGDRFKSIVTCTVSDYSSKLDLQSIMEAELFYYGNVLHVPDSKNWLIDVFTNSIPIDKIVFEDSVQESLSNETNQLDFDSLCSIKDMLESTDCNTVSASLKALSMMDWMHYPNSVKFILGHVRNKWVWINNKACNSASVKYMLNTICNTKRKRQWPGYYDDDIYKCDYNLFKQLACHYLHIEPNQIYTNLIGVNFMYVNNEGFVSLNIKAMQ